MLAIVLLVVAVSGYLIGYELQAMQHALGGMLHDPQAWTQAATDRGTFGCLISGGGCFGAAGSPLFDLVFLGILHDRNGLRLWVAVPIGYVMSRCEFRGKSLIDAVLDVDCFAAVSGGNLFVDAVQRIHLNGLRTFLFLIDRA